MQNIPNGVTQQLGFVVTIELLLFASILVGGTITGWVIIRDSFNAELMDTANAIEGAINFPYFSDPLRRTGPDIVYDSLLFTVPGDEDFR
tara:strand:- start:6186 stop:6455 length:270 start_codon:yes stop_codon:yes gene_type:complete